MNLTELVDVVSDETELTKGRVRETLKLALDTIAKEVKKGGRVTIVGFGAFYSTKRRARIGRNPKTGEELAIPSARVPRFRPGKTFKLLVRKAK